MLEAVDQVDDVAGGGDRLEAVAADQGDARMVGVQLLAYVVDDVAGLVSGCRRRPKCLGEPGKLQRIEIGDHCERTSRRKERLRLNPGRQIAYADQPVGTRPTAAPNWLPRNAAAEPSWSACTESERRVCPCTGDLLVEKCRNQGQTRLPVVAVPRRTPSMRRLLREGQAPSAVAMLFRTGVVGLP